MLELGLKGEALVQVTPENTAAAMGSGALAVFATPAMIALMERAAMDAVKERLEPGQGTVGTELCVSHMAATPVGLAVRAESELTEIDGRMLTFQVSAWAGEELIGRGTHRRCIVQNERFLAKANAKAGK